MKTLITLTKLSELEGAEHPHNIPEGDVQRGWLTDEPKIGNHFNIQTGATRLRSTSPVTEILENDTFKTLNSLYKIERSLIADDCNVFDWIVNGKQ